MIEQNEALERLRSANPVPGIDDIDDEFALFLSHFAERSTVTADTEYVTPPPRSRRTMGDPHRRRWSIWAFAATFVLTVAAIGVVVLVSRSGEPDVADEPLPNATVQETPATTTAAVSTVAPPTPAPSTTVVPVADTAPLSWEGHRIDAGPDGGGMRAVTVGAPGLIAVGYVGDSLNPETGWDAAVWLSTDGVAWSRVGDPEVFAGTPGSTGQWVHQSIYDVAADADGVVAVGADGFDIAVWRSSDGIEWVRITSETLTGRNVGEMHSVTTGGPGFVAFGTAGQGAAVWVSADGTEWDRIEDEDLSHDVTTIGSIHSNESGLIAINGATVWVSADGLNWDRLPEAAVPSDPDTGTPVSQIVGSPGAFLALGSSGPAWTSVDGRTWTAVDSAVFVSESGNRHTPTATISSNGKWIAVGGTVGWGTGIWISPDSGITWRLESVEASDFDSGPIWDLVEYRGELIAVGGSNSGYGEVGYLIVWVGSWE